jgi:YbbR domain-containing protein
MLRSLFTENLGWKALSIIISVFLWWAMVGEPEITMSISVPVQYLNMPKHFEISSDVVEQVHLEIRGPSGKLSTDALQEAAIILNLSSVGKPGERTFPINPADAYLPIGVQLIRAVPSQVRIQFDRRLARTVPVSVRIARPPQKGYEIVAQSVEPTQLRLVGPETRVREIEFIETDPLDLSEVVARTEFTLEVFVPDSYVRLDSDGKMFDSKGRVRVSVDVRKKETFSR